MHKHLSKYSLLCFRHSPASAYRWQLIAQPVAALAYRAGLRLRQLSKFRHLRPFGCFCHMHIVAHHTHA